MGIFKDTSCQATIPGICLAFLQRAVFLQKHQFLSVHRLRSWGRIHSSCKWKTTPLDCQIIWILWYLQNSQYTVVSDAADISHIRSNRISNLIEIKIQHFLKNFFLAPHLFTLAEHEAMLHVLLFFLLLISLFPLLNSHNSIVQEPHIIILNTKGSLL